MNTSSPDSSAPAAHAADLHAIAALQQHYAALNDAGLWHEAAALFLEDGRFSRPSDPTRPLVGREAILRSFMARPPGPARRHLVTQPTVQFSADGDSATACCHSVLLAGTAGDASTLLLGGFRDALRRTPQGWRFAVRSGFSIAGPMACTLPITALLAALDDAGCAPPDGPSPTP